MPVLPNLIERLILFNFNRGPGLLLDIFGAGAFQAIALALKLGVFEAIGDGSIQTEDLARQIKCDKRGTKVLLEFLEAFGYVKGTNGGYANTSLTAKWLLRGSPFSLADMVKVWDSRVFEFWKMHLEESVLKGKPPLTIYEWFDQQPDGWRIFNSFEKAVARWAGEGIINKVKLPPKARKLLDIGGGHGMYSIMFCRRYPNLSAMVFDQPQSLAAALETIASENMIDRVSVHKGDFWVDDLGSGYDVALLFNIIHSYSPDKNAELLRKVAGTLNPGGLVVIFDQLAGTAVGPASKALARFFGLNYLATVGGQTYSVNEVSDWLLATSFANPRRIRSLLGLVIATKIR